MAEPLDITDMRHTLARVSAYRQVCEGIRGSAGQTCLHGLYFVALAVFYYFWFKGFHPFLIGPLVLGGCELLVALWKSLRPSPECVLVDGILQTVFVLSIAVRVAAWVQLGGNPRQYAPIILFGLWVAYGAFNTFRHYAVLRKVFPSRPGPEHLAYVEDLIEDIHFADPHTDPTAVELSAKPRLKAKLLGDVAFFYNYRTRELFLYSRDEMDLSRTVRDDGEAVAELTVPYRQFAPFPITAESWQNYAKWKAAAPPYPDASRA